MIGLPEWSPSLKGWGKMVLIGIFSWAILQPSTYSQPAQLIDSLETQLTQVANAADRIEVMQQLVGLIWRSQPERAKTLSEEIILLAKELQKPLAEGMALIHLGYYELYQGTAIQALVNFQEAARLLEADPKRYNRALQEQANAHYQLGNLEEAIRLSLAAVSFQEEARDSISKARTLNNIGLFHSANQNFHEARYYLSESIRLKRLLGREKETISGYNNLANLFFEMEEPDSTVHYALVSLELQDHTTRPMSRAVAQQLLGLGYLGQGKLELAQTNLAAAQIGYHELGVMADEASAWLDLAKVAKAKGQGNELQRLAERARKLARESGRPAIHSESLHLLASSQANRGEFEAAYFHLLEERTIRDSIFETEKQAEIARMSAVYQTEQQAQKIQMLDQEKRLQSVELARTRIALILAGCIVLLLTGLVVLLIRLSRLRRRTNLELAEKNLQLAQLNATKDRLFSIVAHDLKNPLSAFRSLTHNLTQKWELLDKHSIFPFIQSLNHSSGQLYDLLQNLLQWAISETGNLEIEIQQVSIDEQLDQVGKLMQEFAGQREVQLRVPPKETRLLASSDGQVLHTVLRNLVANALKFTPAGGQVCLDALQIGEEIRISVRDTGIGISKADQAKLFRLEVPVQRIGQSEQKGTGLGLILCKELLDKVGGRIWLESEAGKGTTFFVSLPAA